MSRGDMDPEPIVLPDGQMQHGRMRRQRVMKELRHGRTLSTEDLPVAAALVDQQRSRQRWLLPLLILAGATCLSRALNEHGSQRWIWFGFLAGWVVTMWLGLREQRRLSRNFEQQITPKVDDLGDEVAS